jgi:hypothetical protein
MNMKKNNTIKKLSLDVLVVVAISCAAFASGFEHSLSGAKPWTGENFLCDPQDFQFAIVGDRTGGERKGYFAKAMDALNLLRPEFVMSVGDLIDGGGAQEKDLRRQWDDLEGHLAKLQMPFFHVVGNHDIWTGFTGPSKARATSIKLWHEYRGTNTYYSFKYKGCLFVCLDSMETHEYYPPREAMSEKQLEWAARQFEENANVRWRFIFLHKPLDFMSDRWLKFERKIAKYDYTVFFGDWHNHVKAVRNGKNYYMVGTTGGGIDGRVYNDLRGGYMDSVTWVTMTKKGPVVANLALSGIYNDEIQRCATTDGWMETPLDYPSHRIGDMSRYAGEKNTALVPAEVMEGPGYDWHFKLAIQLRQGKVYEAGIEKMPEGNQRVALLGDETASAKAAEFGKDTVVFDFGFKGDKTQNVIWRLLQGQLEGYKIDRVVISVGRHNRGENTPEEIAAAQERIVSLVRASVPNARIDRFFALSDHKSD